MHTVKRMSLVQKTVVYISVSALIVGTAMFVGACTKRCLRGSVLRNGVCVQAQQPMASAAGAASDTVEADGSVDPIASDSTNSTATLNSDMGAVVAGAGGAATVMNGALAGTPGTNAPAMQSATAGTPGAANDVCTSGETSCDGNDLRQCGAEGWMAGMTCPYVCIDGRCGGECVPGSVQCADNVVQLCSEQGLWETAEECPNVCADGACAGMCVPDSKQCSGETPQTCDASGQWVSAEPCEFVCKDGACIGECKPNDVRCNELTPETCDAMGSWEASSPCPYMRLSTTYQARMPDE